MTERLRYYALVLDDRPATNPHSVFREVRADDDYRTDVWDRALGAWRMQLSLIAYTPLGEELGAIPITATEAEHIIATASAV